MDQQRKRMDKEQAALDGQRNKKGCIYFFPPVVCTFIINAINDHSSCSRHIIFFFFLSIKNYFNYYDNVTETL